MAALKRIWEYIYAVNKGHTVEEVLAMLVEAVGEEEREGLLSVADQLIERGRKEEGHEMLLMLLDARFGEVPAGVVRRLKAADSAQLRQWAKRALSVSTLAEVFGET